ncbi:hemolysin D [Actibacterium mucosum KCTC 23349]|uniref:Hemolysin D n=1 Tax=Actibacterium mucosum KCTC 23349 TaxID=1454373 RepID=A0A037ZKV3_9RHOB|nr:efflux RND transporter periplasmic adaptor subunit [Actibacterium mucosum]KAJ57076.1 hemolysin D [Actibacterium mucosum KCTC 23349]
MRQLGLAIAAALLPFAAMSQELAIKPVKVITIEKSEQVLERHFFGKVVARQTVDLAFQVGGQVLMLDAIEGTDVAAGAVIAQLDLVPFELAEEQARLQKEQADRTVTRLTRLQGSSVSQVSVDDAQTAAGLAGIALRNAEDSLSKATLHAPFDAVVAARNVETFSTVSPGMPVVRLHDMSELRIEIDVPEILFQRAGEDPSVEITAQFPFSAKEYPLDVREFNAEASAIGQTYQLTFALQTPEDLRVLPGSSVTVRARLNEGRARTLVPPTALGVAADKSLYVVAFDAGEGDTGVARLIPVKAESTANGDFLITSGLDDGAVEILATGVDNVADGQTVRRFGGFPN